MDGGSSNPAALEGGKPWRDILGINSAVASGQRTEPSQSALPVGHDFIPST